MQGVSVGGVSVQGGFSLGDVSIRETPRTVMNGRYASYWNAFLLTNSCETSRVFFFTIKDNIKNLPLQEAKGNDCFAQIPICMFFAC